MLNKKLALEVINLASSTGADFVEIFYEDTYSSSISVENGKVDNNVNSNISGVGLRLLKENRSVYGSTSDVSRKGLLSLAETLSKSFQGERVIPEVTSFEKVKAKELSKVKTSLTTVSKTEIADYLKNVNSLVKNYDSRIVRVTTGLGINVNNTEIFNSNGKYIPNKKEYGRMFIMSIASENGKIETRFDGPGAQAGWEFFTEKLDVEALAKENASKLIMMLQAKECPSGKFPVIIGNGWGGVIFHEACGHQLEATSVAKGLSVFSGKKGEKIANDIVSAYDDATIPNEWGTYNVDDEGNIPAKNALIENGVLVGYLVDDFNGRRMGEKGNGACRRQNYKFEPTSRMGNTYIANGKSTKEEIIANTKLALYAVSFGGGSVNPATGDFNFGCSEAYIVKDGKILEPVRGATLVGNAKEILKHIDMVGNDLAFGQGMCGSASGSIPVNVGQPTIRVDEIVVGGRGGSIDEF